MEDEPKRQRSEALRVAHRELLLLVDAIAMQLTPSELRRDATATRAMLSMLAGKLTVHLAMEDNALYPRLAVHENRELRALAQQIKNEMGDIHAAFKQYLSHWPDAEAIQANSADFIRETRQIFDPLRTRIAKEDIEIFSRLDDS